MTVRRFLSNACGGGDGPFTSFFFLLRFPERVCVLKTSRPKMQTNKLFIYSLSVLALSKTAHCFLVPKKMLSVYKRPPS